MSPSTSVLLHMLSTQTYTLLHKAYTTHTRFRLQKPTPYAWPCTSQEVADARCMRTALEAQLHATHARELALAEQLGGCAHAGIAL